MMNAPINLPDAPQRQLALMPTQSFIVQAPAGSGKTELLVQRYLSLLVNVHSPEAIIAITFTCKAANEMRLRIIQALEMACSHSTPPSEALQRIELARKVLEHDQRRGWNLLANPNRLRIQTIDSLCQSLTRQMPSLSTLGGELTPVENPKWLYRLATQELLSQLEKKLRWQKALIDLLTHLDNNYPQVEKLLHAMLANREQWLNYLVARQDGLRDYLEQGLQRVNQEIVNKLNQLISPELQEELYHLLNFSYAQRKKKSLPQRNDRTFWKAAASLLLTESQEWRKQFRKPEGFPGNYSCQNKTEKAEIGMLKQRMIALVEKLSQKDAIKASLLALKTAPPLHYTDTQWNILNTLFELLPVLVAHLQTIFQQQKKVDYTEILLCALAALGHPENPTDLALNLDYQIEHLLVDEFQDTSSAQLRLIEKLTAGWEENNGKSLFLVGDPMQSIYRFRKAEVGLFLQVQRRGLGSIRLHPLTLTVNFRSERALVDWVNQSFSRLLPSEEATHPGSIPFSSSIAFSKKKDARIGVKIHWLDNSNSFSEANKVVEIIQDIKEREPGSSIVILVRARTHLVTILPCLTTASIPYQAIEIDSLAKKRVVQDLLALTRALLHLGDKIAWLALLRAPYCGLRLNDLHAIAQGAKNHVSSHLVWQQLKQFASLKISEDARQRLTRIVPILQNSLSEQGRVSIAQWVKETWVQLGGPTTLESTEESAYIESFYSYLEKKEILEGGVIDVFHLEEDLAEIYVQNNDKHFDTIDIMTIHKAKGLEYDHVIVPGLHRSGGTEKNRLLLYSEDLLPDQDMRLLFAPIKASSAKEDLIYDYLWYEEKKKKDDELTRLLYVASTRAKKSLHLLGILARNEKGDIKKFPQNSLLNQLWPIIKADLYKKIYTPQPQKHSNDLPPSHHRLKRLASDWKNPIPFSPINDTLLSNPHFSYLLELDHPARILGILIHRLLYQISQDGLHVWDKESIHKKQGIFHQLLKPYSISHLQKRDLLIKLKAGLQKTLIDPRGRWILDPQQYAAHSELALTALLDGKLQNLIIDRTFIDKLSGVRWIIDYKTTTYEGINSQAFLHKEAQQHKKQLETYAAALALDSKNNHPIHLGLYFPLTSLWYEWRFVKNYLHPILS